MSFIPLREVEAPPPGVTPVAELRGIISHFPDGLGAFDQMYERMVGQGRLDQGLRYVLLAAAARWRSDDYIAGFMFGQALEAGMSADDLGSLIGEAEGDEQSRPEAALLAFCRKVTESAFKMVQSDVDALQAHGWTTGQVVEAVTMVSLSGYMTVLSAAGGLLEAPALEAEPWR